MINVIQFSGLHTEMKGIETKYHTTITLLSIQSELVSVLLIFGSICLPLVCKQLQSVAVCKATLVPQDIKKIFT